MKRREFLQATGLGLAASAVAAPAVAQSMPEIKWRLTASWPKSLDTLWGGVEFFCKRVAEITDNRLQIQPFAAGELVPGLQVLDAVQNGTVEMGNTAMYYYWGKDPAMTFGTALPFGLNSRQMYSWLHHGGGNELLNEVLKNFNCIGRAAGNTGAQMGGWFRKEIKTTEDLKGLKFRVGGFAGTILARVGAVPQQLAGGDIYPALEKGTIDAAEWVGPYDDEKLGFYKIAKNYYYPGWWEGCGQGHNIVNLAKWNELPKIYQTVILTVSDETWGCCWDATTPAIRRHCGGWSPAARRYGRSRRRSWRIATRPPMTSTPICRRAIRCSRSCSTASCRSGAKARSGCRLRSCPTTASSSVCAPRAEPSRCVYKANALHLLLPAKVKCVTLRCEPVNRFPIIRIRCDVAHTKAP
jgi:TRAP-type mannitol/chloroaromatic compound transport system substrate-binding protein